ncbi:hypothetical protein Acry_2674 [Acidiphilium cryptum JF-5]|uniref:Uncharacterized protein n=1 Tax=Acidiphilium cryptum (strain JF-5) TaxID=349163 RepID=A5G1Y3_ACICJ|nr:hypothetical protein Acry_2674 [Acidiphilium cryptum JF-5]
MGSGGRGRGARAAERIRAGLGRAVRPGRRVGGDRGAGCAGAAGARLRCFGEQNPEGAAERAEDAAEPGFGGDEGAGFGFGEEGAELRGGGGGFGHRGEQPAPAARQVRRAAGAGRARGGFARARTRRRCAGGEAGKAGDGALQAGPEQDGQGVGIGEGGAAPALPRRFTSERPGSTAPGDCGAEGVKDRGEAGGQVHAEQKTMDGRGWAIVFHAHRLCDRGHLAASQISITIPT